MGKIGPDNEPFSKKIALWKVGTDVAGTQ